MLAADEHGNAIPHNVQITSAVASDRLTSASIADICAVMTTTSASIVGMSVAWKVGGAGTRCMFIEMQGFS
jgi:hypothetical protein